MKFNQYLWSNYSKTKEGVETIGLFEKGTPAEIVAKYGSHEDFPESLFQDFVSNAVFVSKSGNPDKDLYAVVFENIIENGILFKDDKGKGSSLEYFLVEDLLSLMPIISIVLYRKCAPYFKPYFFKNRFDQLAAIADNFEIELPKIPLKRYKKDRVLYYLELLKVFAQFQDSNSLTDAEMCAFLYDFAPKYLGSHEKLENELPQPTQVWLVGGDKFGGDFEYLDNPVPGQSHYWQGNIDTKRGDIIIMYCLAPRSSIHSIWRATADGTADPFFHFYSSIYIGEGQKVEPIHLNELKSDPYFGSHPLVRKNFQGVNGYSFSSIDYNAILSMLEKKGQDINVLPKLYSPQFDSDANLANERDVEIHLIEPFLLKLGYAEKDWVRQLSVRMGRGERNFPDYTFLAKKEKGFETAFLIIEAKYHIKNNAELEETFRQTWSYALRLSAKTLVLADKNAVWIYQKQNDSFDRSRYVKKYWKELEALDVFMKISKLLGKL